MAYIQYNLQFFAADGPGGEKTEPASSKKLDDARKDGKVAKSKDFVNAASLLAFFLSIKIFGPSIRDSFYEVFHEIYDLIPDIVENSKLGFGTNAAVSAINYGMLKMIIIVLPFFVVGVVMSFVLNVFQVKWKVTTKPLEPKLDKFNPINGFKRIFSMNTIIELLKSVVMITLIGIIAYQTIKKNYRYIFTFYDMSLNQAIGTITSDVVGLGIKISAILLIVGAADYMYQKYKFNKDMMMTKQEV
ncbi:MAG TPA: flagellar biosynthesis protein FlhB, partial [Eubacterium sp.]|nr:flagellar biosynthesis protein FlhB [Eubacterium sp.]